jgi:hypothetical protein
MIMLYHIERKIIFFLCAGPAVLRPAGGAGGTAGDEGGPPDGDQGRVGNKKTHPKKPTQKNP